MGHDACRGSDDPPARGPKRGPVCCGDKGATRNVGLKTEDISHSIVPRPKRWQRKGALSPPGTDAATMAMNKERDYEARVVPLTERRHGRRSRLIFKLSANCTSQNSRAGLSLHRATTVQPIT